MGWFGLSVLILGVGNCGVGGKNAGFVFFVCES
jgi:hypothetical protein